MIYDKTKRRFIFQNKAAVPPSAILFYDLPALLSPGEDICPEVTMSKEKKTVYISGKMRGVPYYNFPKFDAASGRLDGLGFNVLSPADMDREVGFDPCKLSEWDKLPDSFDLSAAVERDNAAIDKSDAIYVISDGISTSTGGMAEIERGMKAGKIILFDTMTDERILRVMGVSETNDCRERERLAEALTLAFCVIAIAASVLYALVRALLK